MYDTTSAKSSLWVNHGKIRDLACFLPSTVTDASGLDGYIESVEMYNYYKSIPTGLISAQMTYHLDRDGIGMGHSSIESHYRFYILQY